MRLVTAFRAFFRVLFDRDVATRVDLAIAGPDESAPPKLAPPEKKPAEPKPKPKPAVQSEAITLLAALQREARLIDFLQEPLDCYSDAQIGAAARDVHRESRAVLARMFALEPILDDEEGAAVEVPAGYDTGVYRLTGSVTGDPPFRGTMVHHGWRATVCQVPEWSGKKDAATVVAPVEVEMK